MEAQAPWQIAGTYLEACNCEVICPCRAIDGARGGRSTYGECLGALSWAIESGCVGEIDVSGLAVGLAFRYDDDEAGSPWTYVLYLDERGRSEHRNALEDVFLGRRGGTPLEQFPWARKQSSLVAVREAEIDIGHSERPGWFRVRRFATLRISAPVDTPAAVTCAIPGHHQAGSELIVERLAVHDGDLRFEFFGRCGYESRFDYGGPPSTRSSAG